MLVLLRLKEIFSHRFAVCLLLLAPVIFGYIGSVAFSGTAELSIALVDEDNSGYSEEYIGLLKGFGLKLIITDQSEAEKLVEKRSVEGLLLIKNGFETSVSMKKGKPLIYTASAGVSSTSTLVEQFSLAVVRLRSSGLYQEAVKDLDMTQSEKRAVFERNADEVPVLVLKTDKELDSSALSFVSPKHGFAALFMTLSTLFSALWLGTKDVYPQIAGRSARLLNYISSLAALFVLWSAQLVVYALSSVFLYPGFEAAMLPAFAALLLYCVGIGAFMSLLLTDSRDAVYAFIPFFLLNMTVGGALWLSPSQNIFIKLLAPVSLFLEASWGSSSSLLFLSAGGVIMLFVPVVSFMRGK